MSKIQIIAQNFDIYEGDGLDKFARTGEISLKHIHKAGAEGVILGHSEAGDAPEAINKKLLSILKCSAPDKARFNKIVILVGESWSEFNGSTKEKVAELLKQKCEIVFRDIPPQFLSSAIIGYEPKWGSRGSGRDDMPPPQLDFISSCIKALKSFIKEKYGGEMKIKPHFIYGGRSTPERINEILADKNIDGFILGSACNTVAKTLAIASAMQDISKNRKKVLICNFKAYDLPDSYEKYIAELCKLPEDFIILLAPAYTDISAVGDLAGKKCFL